MTRRVLPLALTCALSAAAPASAAAGGVLLQDLLVQLLAPLLSKLLQGARAAGAGSPGFAAARAPGASAAPRSLAGGPSTSPGSAPLLGGAAGAATGGPGSPTSQVRPLTISGGGGAGGLQGPVQSWGYRLQPGGAGCAGMFAELAASPYDLLVVDYACDGSPLTASQVEALRRRPGGGARVVLAYMSIGEAESYRWYWQAGMGPGSPSWIAAENPNWPENFKVRYWDPGWQNVLLGPGGYVEQVVAAGFDGVYLDIVDAYEAFQGERPSAKRDMVQLIESIRARGRTSSGRSSFAVFPQNAPELLADPEVGAYLASLIDGIGLEDLYFTAHDAPQDPGESQRKEAYVAPLVAAGKPVLTVDYCTQQACHQASRQRARARGFVPYTTHVELDRAGPPP